MVSSYFQNKKSAQASCSNTTIEAYTDNRMICSLYDNRDMWTILQFIITNQAHVDKCSSQVELHHTTNRGEVYRATTATLTTLYFIYLGFFLDVSRQKFDPHLWDMF